MADIIRITELELPALDPYRDTNEKLLKQNGIFVAESPKVIRTALSCGYEPVSLLCEEKYITGQAADIIARCGEIPVYTADSGLLTELTGFRMTQGILCAVKRKPEPYASQITSGKSRIAVLEDITNQTNVGAVFRSAAALSFDAVLLTPRCSDPLFRRSVRVSMGTVFQVPWTYLPVGSPDYVQQLRELGFTTAAMALRNDTIRIDDPGLRNKDRLAVILGTEGDGLADSTIAACDYTVRIPMAEGVDSLNVAAASAVAFWQLGKMSR